MTSPPIGHKNRGVVSYFKESGRAKLSVLFNDAEISWLNEQAKKQGISLAELVRRAVRSQIESGV